ncbi:aspartyl protease family protein [bacterium]|nr:aspartyl protease family protein [bacterium]
MKLYPCTKTFSATIMLLLLWVVVVFGDERILIDTKVNDKPVCFVFDTGTEYSILFREAAQRLGLRVTDPPEHLVVEAGKVKMGFSEECRLSLLGSTANKMRFRIFDQPSYLPFKVDGFIAWANLKNNIFHIDAEEKELTVLDALSEDIGLWTKWTIRQDSRLLAFRLSEGGTIFIDTGSPYGVRLSPKRWIDWRRKHPKQPSTLTVYYVPADGLVIHEECWAQELSVGEFSICNIPVAQSAPYESLLFKDYEATLGLFALTRLDIIIDGKKGRIYTRPNPKSASQYQYNRFGAVFVPKDMKSNDLIAHVIDGSPAHDAGIRNDDILLSIDDLDATKWRTDPSVLPLSRFWGRPAGTKLKLILKRDKRAFTRVVQLKEIFGEQSSILRAP